ncbi:MAG: hypothetical protein IJQ25_08290 [Oscillibacter sp.]|nr:hypothetical protein [Oscillibacter sp.]MBQ7681394.1 hypothetical protein [Oscillibacter sp.]
MANLNAGDLIGAILNASTSANQNAQNTQSAQNTQNSGLNLGDLGGLVQAIQNTKILDAEKLNALKTGLLSLAGSEDLAGALKLKLAPLLAVLQTVQGGSAESNQKAWELIKPFLGDKDKLTSLVSSFGQYGGKLLEILKAVFLRS